ncbi:MAG: acetyl-CoA carboxylase biotin carboxyl carrier protein subunit [Acidobacteria bacterium]|nr:acetyl-CoA carboxylase biotin carboxyl carrier protein subunit [Acidobacteriota bacterium]
MEIGGRRFRASVAASATGGEPGRRLRVVLTPVDGEGETIERVVDVRATPHGYSLVECPRGRVVDGAVTVSNAREAWLVQLPGVDLEVAVNGRRHSAVESADAGGGEQRVVAPMPGRVLRVLVEPGAAVVSGQPLIVIEAMKMENALAALRDGVVHEVAVAEGVSVEAGRLLLRIG